MPEQARFDWSIPPLDSTEQRLVDAYQEVGRPLDDLAYTEDFRRLCAIIGAADNDESRHAIYKQLLRLRKTGRLPRLGFRE